MTLPELREKITAGTADFNEVIAYVDNHYTFTPTAFKNGETANDAGRNNGACKIFAFAKLHGLSKRETLAAFGAYYFVDVLKHRDGTDHQNIRNFMKHGWTGIRFDGEPLKPR